MAPEIQDIVLLLKQTFEKGAWHGPTVKEGLADISAEQAQSRFPNTHSIIELVGHMTAWRIYVLKKLAGDQEYKVSDERNFPATTDWQKTVKELEESQDHLLKELEKLPAEKLNAQVPGATAETTYYTLLQGIIHHDLYHAGQIVLIKKAIGEQTI